jgi:hypothetical protein
MLISARKVGSGPVKNSRRSTLLKRLAVSFYRNAIIPDLFFRMVKTVIVPAMVKEYLEEREKRMRQAEQDEKAEKKARKTRQPRRKVTIKSESEISDSLKHS